MIRPVPAWPGKPAVWRWHFYAGLFCLPFVLWLSLTGSVYLFRPQVEAWLDRPYAAVAAGDAPRASAAAQAEAAVRAVPGSVLNRYLLPETATQAVQVIVGRSGRETRVYLNPQTLAVLKTIDEDLRPMSVVLRLHGELLAGDAGSYLIELAASWTIVLILTGLYLWWPAGRGPAGVLYPRLRAGGRRFWRDLHAVTGIWVSVAALFLLFSGLPWTKSWGGYLKTVRKLVEPAPPRQDWSTGHATAVMARQQADAGTRAMLTEHAEHRGMTMAHPAQSYAPLDPIAAAVRPLGLAAPILIAPPTGPGTPWTAKSDAANRPFRTSLTLDDNGTVLTRTDFAQRRLLDRLVGWGIAIHEGQAFGWLNQLLNLLTAIGLSLIVVSGTVMWWCRRPSGSLGAPPGRPFGRAMPALAAAIVLLGVLLPLFGLSLLAVLLADRLARTMWRRARPSTQ